MTESRRITLVGATLSSGGAERVQSTMANYWAEKGWDVSFITVYPPVNGDFYQLHPKITRTETHLFTPPGSGLKGRLKCIYLRHDLLRKAIFKSAPQVIISFLTETNVRTILASRGVNAPLIISERVNLDQEPPLLVWRLLRRLTFPFADKVVVQTKGILTQLPWTIRRKACAISNPVTVTGLDTPLPVKNLAGKKLIGAGRLAVQKRFDLLIAAFSQVAPLFPEWTVDIWGGGPEKERLQTLIDKLGLGDRIVLKGVTRTLWQEMRAADLFVLSSQWEGLPNALCEAMACGLPVISYDCPTGPSDIIHHAEDGLLVPPCDVAALAAAMKRLMGDPAERDRLAANATQIRTRLSLERIMEQWERIIESTLK